MKGIIAALVALTASVVNGRMPSLLPAWRDFLKRWWHPKEANR